MRRNTRDGCSSKIDDEENSTLAIKVKNWKGKASQSKLDYYHGGKNKDTMKFNYFYCHELGHFATHFPLKKSQMKS